MMRQWEEVSKEEEKIAMRSDEGVKTAKRAGTKSVTGADEERGKGGEGKEEGGRLVFGKNGR